MLICAAIAIHLPLILCLLQNPDPAGIPASSLANGAGDQNPTPKSAATPDWRMPPAQRAEVLALGRLFLEGLNADDAGRRAEIVHQVYAEGTIAEYGVERLARHMGRVHNDFGTLDYHSAELSETPRGEAVARSLHVYARQNAASKWLDLQFRIEPAPPYKLAQLFFIAHVAEPAYLPNGSILDAETQEWLGHYVDRLVSEEDLAGSLLIAHHDTPVFERYFGFADAARTKPITANTRMNLASGNKMMTAIAAAQLVEKGKLALDDPLIKFMPDFPNKEFASRATVRHLLSHTSGVGEYWTQEYDQTRFAPQQLTDFLPYIYKVGIDFNPGENHRYSNSNFILAGIAVEKASEQTFYDYVRDHITTPLGLANTGFYSYDGSEPDLAEALLPDGKDWKPLIRRGRGSSAGGGYSTPRDVLAFARGFVGGKLVTPEMVQRMTTSQTSGMPGAQDNYGLGFILERHGDYDSFGHGGTAPGVSFELRYFPARDITLVVFSNQDNGAIDSLRKTALKLISGER